MLYDFFVLISPFNIFTITQLTLMPSLDTLDISYNKIKRLPSQPGQLVQLRVSLAILYMCTR